jgi:hypothetical protein
LSLYVVDANIVAKWFVPEPLSEKADERLVNALAGGTLAPHVLWVGAPGEVH